MYLCAIELLGVIFLEKVHIAPVSSGGYNAGLAVDQQLSVVGIGQHSRYLALIIRDKLPCTGLREEFDPLLLAAFHSLSTTQDPSRPGPMLWSGRFLYFSVRSG